MTLTEISLCVDRLLVEARSQGFARPTSLCATRGVPPGHVVWMRAAPGEIRMNDQDAARQFGDPMPWKMTLMGLDLVWAKA